MLTPKRFTDRYRLTPDGFEILYELVKDKLSTLDEAHAKSSKGEFSAW